MGEIRKLPEDLASAHERIRTLEAELERARENAQNADEQIRAARINAGDAEQQIATARENFGELEAQIVAARRERERLLALVEHWRERASARRGFWQGLFARRPRSPLPVALRRARDRVSRRFLQGSGIEIGALHSPVAPARGARVRYVDRLSTAELREAYPEQAEYRLVEVDVLDDGETLSRFDPSSLDFLVASHMLEHCENPLGTLRCHLEKLSVGGVLFYIVPDRRGSFDARRPLTSFEHLERDDREGPEASRWDHYLEFAELVARTMLTDRGNIHFHVWEDTSFRDFLERASVYLAGDSGSDAAFTIEYFELSHAEIIAVLRKR
jgi:predicted SAM-dependent methyltransferase